MAHIRSGRQTSSQILLPSDSTTSSDADSQASQAARHYQEAADGLHYRMTNHEWLLAWDELKPAEIKVLYHLRTLDPWGSRHLDISVTEIAGLLGYNKGTVSRALKALDRHGWITLEIDTARVKLHTKNSSNALASSADSAVASGSSPLSDDPAGCLQTTQTIARQHLEVETTVEQEFQSSLYSLKDQINLKRERQAQNSNLEISQDYRDWLLAKASRLPDPPALRELWLEKQSVNPANLREYEAWQAVQEQRVSSSPLPAPPEQPAEPDSIDVHTRLARYQQQWSVAVMRKGIENAIATHSDWGIEIGPDGPRWRLEDAEPELEPNASGILHQVESTISNHPAVSEPLREPTVRRPLGFGAGIKHQAKRSRKR